MAKILITGGTGSIGTHLIERLQAGGHKPVLLSRSLEKNTTCETFKWDPATGYIDERAFEGIEHVINLAGNGIADKRWTNSRKSAIIESRLKSVKVLCDHLRKLNIRLHSFVGASAIGYYGAQTTEKIYRETDNAANDFLGLTCKQWEESYDPIKELADHVSIIRIGIVLAKNGGVYKKMMGAVKMNLGAILGSGDQYMPWIHVNDLVEIFTQLIEGRLNNGTYNAVAPQHTTNAEFTRDLAASVNKTLLLPKIPAFILKFALGELSCMVLEGSRVSDQKLIDGGFKFMFNDLPAAFSDLAKR